MTATATKIACGNTKVHGFTPGRQHHHYGVAQVRECFASPYGIASIEDEEEAPEYDADAAYERHLENAGWSEAALQDEIEAQLGVLPYEDARDAAEAEAKAEAPSAPKVDFTGLPDGVYTVYLDQHEAHRTFRVQTQRETDKFAPGQRILSVLVGSDNENDYTGLGFVSTDSRGVHHLRPWKKYHASGVATQEAAQTLLNDPREALVAGRCFKCRRLLTTPESLEWGIGPECRKKAGL